jgi:putative GTP pyrophosphokinase
MPDESEEWLKGELPKHVRLSAIVKSLLESLLTSHGIETLSITGRAKTLESAVEKIKRKSYSDPADQMTDLSGIRIVTYFDSQIKLISDLIRSTFEVDESNSLDQINILGNDKIGYRSVHFVCRLGQQRNGLPEYMTLSGLPFEIQVRTVLQHAWAELAHDRSYKFGQGLPTKIQRKLNLYSGMLEIVDSGFDEISQEIDRYIKELRSTEPSSFLEQELNTLSLQQFVETMSSEAGLSIAIKGSEFVLEELRSFGMHTISDLSAIVTPTYIDEYRRAEGLGNPTDTIAGFLRTAMLYHDADRYLKASRPTWSGLPVSVFRLIASKIGRQELEDILKRYGKQFTRPPEHNQSSRKKGPTNHPS